MTVGVSAGKYRAALQADTPCVVCDRRTFEVVATRDRRGRPLRTVMCTACGLVWTNPRPSDEDVDRYYARDYRADYSGARRPTLRKLLRGLQGAEARRQALGPLVAPGVRVLDVGCGAGEFVFVLRRHGVEASGLEPGEEYAEFSRGVLGIPVQIGTVESAAVASDSVQVVTMFHMLEHTADPRRVLGRIREWLAPDRGRLVVEVPNVESTVQAPAHRFHYAHLYSFTPATLAALGTVAGFRPVRTETTADGGNITCVFERDPAGPRRVEALPDAVARLRQVFRTSTWLRHYCTGVPYRRALGRLRGRWREDRVLRRCRTVEDLLHLAAPPASRLD